MQTLFLAASLASPAAHALVLDLEQVGTPIATVDGYAAVAVELPSRVLADQEALRLVGLRGTSVRARDGIECTVALTDGSATLSPAYDRCAELYGLSPAAHRDLLVQPPAPQPARIIRLVLAPSIDSGPAVVETDGRVLLPGAPADANSAWFFVGGRWWPAALRDETWALQAEGEAADALQQWLHAPDGTAWLRAGYGDGTEVQWILDPAQLPLLSTADGGALPAPSDAATTSEPLTSWCRTGNSGGDLAPTYLFCLDADSGQTETRRFLRSGTLVQTGHRTLPTGSFIEVVVRHAPGHAPTIELAGGDVLSRGEELLGTAPASQGERVSTRRRFAPRAAGPVSLRVTDGDDALLTEELSVVERYQGAIRVGVGVTTPATHTFASSTDGSTAGPIVRTSDDLVEGELVVGFSPFIDVGGRDYIEPAPYRLAPYVGLGLLSASGAELRATALQSWYGGLDVEFTPGFTVDAALTLRRVQRLVDGQEVGMYLADGDSVQTRMVFRPGLAVVISATPAQLRIRSR